jgi:hypothetical protein
VRADDFNSIRLSAAPRAALSHVEGLVRRQEPATSLRVRDVLRRAGCRLETYREAIECVRGHARVVVHFHPDRIGNKPKTVAAALLEEGIYRNQFETGISAGGLSAFPSGPRDTWERTLFGGAYHTEDVTDSERPKYGALELVRYSDGPIPRFGSCYLVLQPSVTRRTSFTFAGSEDPRATEQLGTIDRMENVMAEGFEAGDAEEFTKRANPPVNEPSQSGKR